MSGYHKIQAVLPVQSKHPWCICLTFFLFFPSVVMENSTEEARTESANCTLTREEAEQSDERQSPAPTGTQTTHTGINLSVYQSLIHCWFYPSIAPSIHYSFYPSIIHQLSYRSFYITVALSLYPSIFSSILCLFHCSIFISIVSSIHLSSYR